MVRMGAEALSSDSSATCEAVTRGLPPPASHDSHPATPLPPLPRALKLALALLVAAAAIALESCSSVATNAASATRERIV